MGHLQNQGFGARHGGAIVLVFPLLLVSLVLYEILVYYNQTEME